MKPYTEVRLARSNELEIRIGTFIGAALAGGAVWLITVLVFSLA